MISVIHLSQMLINLIEQENVLQNQSILGKVLWLKEKKYWRNELTMTANFLEQDQRLKNMMCIICQKPDVHACKVAFKEAAKTMLSAAQK